ncbi:MAG TPA: hypothetical protein VFR53_02585 [Methylomirabilota bacterium]|nr:hypothetical protein [Methylomirabilota bacterium]
MSFPCQQPVKEFKGIVFVGASDVWSVGSRLPFRMTPTLISRRLRP